VTGKSFSDLLTLCSIDLCIYIIYTISMQIHN
jgi:hypothetical protein